MKKQLEQATLLAEQKWGKKPDLPIEDIFDGFVLSVTRVDLETEKDLFKGLKLYAVDVYNPISKIAGPAAHRYAMVFKGDDVIYLETDQQALDFMQNEHMLTVDDDDGARRFARRFALLSRSTLCDKPVSDPFLVQLATNSNFTDWDVTFKKSKTGVEVGASYLVDPEAYRYVRFKFFISIEGNITKKALKEMVARHYS